MLTWRWFQKIGAANILKVEATRSAVAYNNVNYHHVKVQLKTGSAVTISQEIQSLAAAEAYATEVNRYLLGT
jgi:hypothetical protein